MRSASLRPRPAARYHDPLGAQSTDHIFAWVTYFRSTPRKSDRLALVSPPQNGRTLAYVYLKDGTFVNAWLVEHGYAQVMTVPPNVKHQELFLKLQREAKEAGRGLWR